MATLPSWRAILLPMQSSAAIATFIRSLYQKLPGATSGGRLVWLWHLAAAIALGCLLEDWKLPKYFASDLGAPEPNKFGDVFKMGIWYGGWTHLVISSLIVLTVKWWSRPTCATRETKLSLAGAQLPWFGVILFVLVLAALALRWPRMDLSYWGDEGWAVREYVHGEWVPEKNHDYQGALQFKPVTWRHTCFNDWTGGNHFLFSILQRLTLETWRAQKGLPEWAFDECISRLPLLIGGLLSIVTFALLFRWLGLPMEGLCGALYLTVDPWHIRYSTEARGYVLMFLFLTLAIWALLWATRTGKWRAWLCFSITQFLAIYSWKVAAMPLAGINAIAALFLLLKRGAPLGERISAVLRLVVAGLTMTGIFALLYAGPSLQHPRALERLTRTGKPMDMHWLRNSISGLIVGCPWDKSDHRNPTETPLSEALHKSPLRVGTGIIASLGFILIGIGRLYRRNLLHFLIWLSIVACAAGGAAIFKWVMHIEWIFWYSFFALVSLAVFHAVGVGWLLQMAGRLSEKLRPFALVIVLLISVSAYAISFPQIRLLQTQPYESNREAFYLTRGRHEPWNYSGPTNIITCYLWRHIYLYDPRGDSYVRTAQRLHERMAEADASGGELYYVVGTKALLWALQKDVMEELENPALFEKLDVLWAQEAVHTLEIYRYLGKRK